MLRQAFERVTTDRSCHLFTVLGPAGAGKTRLVEEFAAQVEADATVLRGRCLAYGDGITFWPVVELVGQAAGLSILDAPEVAPRKLLTVIGPGERSERIADLVAGLLGLSQTDTPVEESFWALRRFLEILAARQPLILLLDDLQWAEPTFLDLVQHVAEWSRDAPILVLAQSRPELRDDRARLGRRRGERDLDLVGTADRGRDRSADRRPDRGSGCRRRRCRRAWPKPQRATRCSSKRWSRC